MLNVVLVAILIGLLASTNPTMDEYKYFARQHLEQRIDEIYQEVFKNPSGELAKSGLVSLMTALFMLAGGKGQYIEQSILPNTRREDYFIASVYTTHVMENVDLVYLGIFKTFIPLDGQRSSPTAKPPERSSTGSAPGTTPRQPATSPATSSADPDYAVWESDWGNDIRATATTNPCRIRELTEEGYQYSIVAAIPVARLAKREDAWDIQGDLARTLDGCWLNRTDGLVQAKMIRKKDGNVYVTTLNFQDGSWQ